MLNPGFFAPADLNQACSLLADEAIQPLAIAGGTDLMVRFNRHRRRRQETLVYLGKLGLDYIREENGKVLVGACAPLNEIAASPLIIEKLPLLAKACGEMASPAVRNAATLGGNVVNNARHADGVAALTALNAAVVIASTGGERTMAMNAFTGAPKKEKLSGGGIIKHFAITSLGPDETWAWEKLRQRKGESRSVVSVSMRAGMQGGKCTAMRLVIGCMAPNPFVSKAAAELMVGYEPGTALNKKVALKVLEECTPASDARASAWYREKVTAVLIERVLSQLN
ncbi:MAG: FAD binding domain-containing protein [Deltaproteobacteria bacterium]|nr:FAD binding domain-containing protein [Deltaproteobacteria bacterium]